MAPSPLSPFSLPLRFSLLPSLAHPTTPCACLSVQLPLRRPGAPPYQPSQPSFTVTRILDPEHKEPFVSLAPILLASGLTTLEGLLLFGLRTPAYDSFLGGVAPFTDLWIPLPLARTIATRLSRLDELSGLLEHRSRAAWTVEDKEEGGLVSNWKVGSDRIDPAEYSTSAMLSTSFPRVHLLPSGTQVRTFVPPEFAQASPPAGAPPLLAGGFAELHRRLVEWTSREWEDWLEADEDEDGDGEDEYGRRTTSGPGPHEPNLAAGSFLSAGLSLLTLTNGLPPEALAQAPPGSSILLAPAERFPPTARSGSASASDSLSPTSDPSRVASPVLGLSAVPTELELTRQELLAGTAKARLALVDFLTRLVEREWTRSLEADLSVAAQAPQVPNAAKGEALAGGGGVQAEQFAALAARVEALELAAEVDASDPGRSTGAMAGSQETREAEGYAGGRPGSRSDDRGAELLAALEEENARLRERVREMEEAGVAAKAKVQEAVAVARVPAWMMQVPFMLIVGTAIWWWRLRGAT